MNEFASQAGLAVLIVHLIQWMKTSDNPLMQWIGPRTKWVTTSVVWLCTTLTAIGIHWSFNGTLTSGGVLQINIPSLDTVVTAAIGLGWQWGAQKMYYVNAVRAKTPQVETQVTPTVAVIQDIPKP